MKQVKFVRIAVFVETDCHPQLPIFRISAIGAKETIPPGDAETVIAVGLANKRRMVDAVHIPIQRFFARLTAAPAVSDQTAA